MPGAYLYGFDETTGAPVKCKVTAEGKLIINASGFFENPPTEDLATKGPSSEWAFDHNANAAAHHVKYTDDNARAAIGNVINSAGDLADHLECEFKHLMQIGAARFQANTDQDYEVRQIHMAGTPNMGYVAQEIGVGYVNFKVVRYNGSAYVDMIDKENFQAALDDYLENPPTENVANKAPTSEWAFDHDANAAAHHAKYTDAEARASFGAAQITLTTGTYTDESMVGVGSILLNSSGGDITLKGLANGVSKQMIYCYKLDNSNDVYVIHASGDAAAQDRIYPVTAANESIGAGNYGGFWLIYMGSYWVVDHYLI